MVLCPVLNEEIVDAGDYIFLLLASEPCRWDEAHKIR
jgi:hypothetical protein